MMRHLSAAFVIVLVIADSATGVSAQRSPLLSSESLTRLEFREVGPALRSGRVVDMAVDPSHRGTWYVASASGGVWKTTNAGVTWRPIFDEQGSYSIGTVVTDPGVPDRVWVGTGENNAQRSVSFGDGIYRSDDGGETWRRMGLENSEHIARILIDPRDSDRVLVASQGPLWADGGDRGLYETRDGGETWTRILHVSEMTGISDVVFHPREPDVIYASSYQRRRHTGILIAGGPESTIWKSTDGGRSWAISDAGLPEVDRGRIGLAVSPQRPEVVYAVVAAADSLSGFYRSADSGRNWTRMSDWAPGDPQYYQELFPSPFEFDVVYGIEVRLMKTVDGGANWQQIEGDFHVDHHHVGFDPLDPDHLFLGNDGGLYESHDSGVSWRYFDNLPVTQFYRVGTDDSFPFYRIGGGTQDNGTLLGWSQTRDQAGITNAHWGTIQGGDGFEVEVDRFDPSFVFSSSQNGGLQRANLVTDETQGIRPSAPEGEEPRWYWDTPLVASAHVAGRVYVASERVHRSDNRGDDWTAISGDLTKQLDRDTMEVMGRVWPENAVWRHVFTAPLSTIVSLDESPLDADLLVAGTDDGLIQVTEDGGATWRRIDRFPGVPETVYVTDVEASRHDANVIYATASNRKRGDFRPFLLVSNDRGSTWEVRVTGMSERDPLWSVVEDDEDPDILFVGSEFGVYVSTDRGALWQRFGALPTIQVRELEIQASEDDLVLATFGRGFRVFDDVSFLREADAVTAATEAHLFAVKDAHSYRTNVGSSGSSGQQHWRVSNLPYGVQLTVWTGAQASGADTLFVAIRDAATRREINRVALAEDAGLQRVHWNLTEAPPDSAVGGRGGRGGRGGGGGRGGRGGGPPVTAGDFEAAIVRGSGLSNVLTEWRRFSVRPLPVDR
jgi:photosystem II stability/assembly factor-like uncharacterized protein